MKVFVTGASGYIGGSVAAYLMDASHQVSGLARSAETADALKKLGVAPVRGTLDDAQVLARAAQEADAVIDCSNAAHRGAAKALLHGLAGSGKPFIHTSGSSIVGTRAGGDLCEDVFDEDTPFTPSPARAGRVAIGRMLGFGRACRAGSRPPCAAGTGRGAPACRGRAP